LTIQLDRKTQSADTIISEQRDTSTIPWTISGTIIDSRFDLVIESDSTVLLFDGDTVTVTENVNFIVSTFVSGTHTFYLTIPGYHSVTFPVVLHDKEKQLFITIPTTVVNAAISRREITVSAKRLPVHRSAEISKVAITRKELQRTTSTLNDPVRVLQTLPGVASESDASARLIVRGGDVSEARVSLDGISLLQPYHFGGARSMFNQQAIDRLTLYKTGFPAEFHNAQSALIDVTHRMPSDEKRTVEIDFNQLQYSTYVGVPLLNGTAGLFFSSQGSFQEQVLKAILKIGDVFGNNEMKEASKLVQLPDYKDFSAGVSFSPSPKLKILFSEIYNTDKVKFCSGDSVIDVTYKYYKSDSTGNRVLDTVVTIEEYYDEWFNPASMAYQVPLPGKEHDGNPKIGKPRYDIDTMLDYHSTFNVLYGTMKYISSEKSMFTATLAWQKRWWDLNFPTLDAIIDTAIYDMVINQFNFNSGWVYSGKDNHILKAGAQLDYTRAIYDVFIVRYLHHLIVEGSTNFSDVWGPVNGDTSLVLNSYDGDFLYNTMSRAFVSYNGNRNFVNAAIYMSDAWDISNRLHLDAGVRIEYGQADHSKLLSPRLSLKYNLSEKNELLGSIGLYTQNNHDISAIALSEKLTPEKVWHGTLGAETRFLPWLMQTVNIYGKYYFDLTSEIIDNTASISQKDIMDYLLSNYNRYYIDTLNTASYDKLILKAMYELYRYRTRYVNDGKGTAYGLEYLLRYDPTDFWFGWVSFTLGQSVRQRREGWKKHPFPLERPLLISINNYYRLPRKYEISLKYRYLSGLPYTSVTNTNGSIKIGNFNDRRYAAYQRLDIRFSKGYTIRSAKGTFYLEFWNSMNAPNLFGRDSKTSKFITIHPNLPVTMVFVGSEVTF
jgi:outer membrane receptor protein involved in Fe transport